MNHNFRARKPALFFASSSPLPESIVVQVARPAAFANLSDLEFSRRLDAAVRRLVQRARDELDNRGSKFLGASAVRKQSFTATPATTAERRALEPTVATRSASTRARALAKKEAFARAYRRAWQRFRAGARDVKFPAGTYALRLNSAVNCE